MINLSKKNDARQWQRWRESGAVESIEGAHRRVFAKLRTNEIAAQKRANEPLSGLESALQSGCTMHGFLSGGGLRVVRVEKNHDLKGYGEHWDVGVALVHANDDFLAGGRPYKEVYGKEQLEYLTGSSSASSPLDGWLLKGHTFDARSSEGAVLVELCGYAHTETPAEVMSEVDKTGLPVRWSNRGYTYETSHYRFPGGQLGHSSKVVEKPAGRTNADPWIYQIVKAGFGKDFFEATGKAFEASEIEAPNKRR